MSIESTDKFLVEAAAAIPRPLTKAWLSEQTRPVLERLYKRARDAYYNSGTEILSDREFDLLEAVLKRRFPDSAVLKVVGAPVRGKKVQLPYTMGSLQKTRPGGTGPESINNFAAAAKVASLVVSHKIDGVSLQLIYEGGRFVRGYSRGKTDQGKTIGKDITHILKMVPAIPKTVPTREAVAVRAEAVILKRDWQPYARSSENPQGFVNPRAMVAGMINRDRVDEDHIPLYKKIRVIAYSILSHEHLNKLAQLKKLQQWKFTTVSHLGVRATDLDSTLTDLLKVRHTQPYEMDGLVVEVNDAARRKAMGVDMSSGKPKYARAFKGNDSNTENVVVQKVVWSVSRHGELYPKVVFDPVMLSGVMVTQATAKNARFVVDHKINVGATIQVRRAGDVIPDIVRVIKPARTAALPPASLGKYAWNRHQTHLVLDRVAGSDQVQMRRLRYFFKTCGIEGVSVGLIRSGFDLGLQRPVDWLKKSPSFFLQFPNFGQTMANKTWHAIHDVLSRGLPLDVLMDASAMFGGSGTAALASSRLRKIYIRFGDAVLKMDENPDASMAAIASLPGFSDDTALSFIKSLPAFKRWLAEIRPYVVLIKTARVTKAQTSGPLVGKGVVFTGFRDANLERLIEQAGGVMKSTVSRNVDYVLVRDLESDSDKAQKARDLGIPLLTPEQFRRKFKLS